MKYNNAKSKTKAKNILLQKLVILPVRQFPILYQLCNLYSWNPNWRHWNNNERRYNPRTILKLSKSKKTWKLSALQK